MNTTPDKGHCLIDIFRHKIKETKSEIVDFPCFNCVELPIAASVHSSRNVCESC